MNVKRKNLHDWSYVMPNGTQSKLYKTFGGCYAAAHKVYPFDTDRMILMDGQFYLSRNNPPKVKE